MNYPTSRESIPQDPFHLSDPNKNWFLLLTRRLGQKLKNADVNVSVQPQTGCCDTSEVLSYPLTGSFLVLPSFPARLHRHLLHLSCREKLERKSQQDVDCFPVISAATEKTKNRKILVCYISFLFCFVFFAWWSRMCTHTHLTFGISFHSMF